MKANLLLKKYVRAVHEQNNNIISIDDDDDDGEVLLNILRCQLTY